jgi:hypothetical protein
MTAVRSARWFTVAAAVLVAALGIALLDGFLPHTDDGCPVEVHCLVCQRDQGTTPVLPHVLLVVTSFVVVGSAVVSAAAVPSSLATPTAVPRGPPSAPLA